MVPYRKVLDQEGDDSTAMAKECKVVRGRRDQPGSIQPATARGQPPVEVITPDTVNWYEPSVAETTPTWSDWQGMKMSPWRETRSRTRSSGSVGTESL